VEANRFLHIWAVAGLLLFNPGKAYSEQWADPRDNWGQFARWCCEQGGCPDQPTSQCKMDGSGCSHPCSGGSTGSASAPAYDYAAAEAARRAAQEAEENRLFREKEKIDREKRARVEDENDRREENRKYWTEARRKALRERLKPAVEAIYSQEKAVELAAESQVEMTEEVKKAWTQLHCSHSITGSMMDAAKLGDVHGAKYLKEQADKAISGGALGVRCPPAGGILASYGQDALRSTGYVAKRQRELREEAFNNALEIEKIRKEREKLWKQLRKDLGSKELEEATKHLIAEHVKALRKKKEEGKEPETKPEPTPPPEEMQPEETKPAEETPEEETKEQPGETPEAAEKEKAAAEAEKKKKSRQALIAAIAALQLAEEEAGKEVDSLSEASQSAFENPDKVR